jgi:endogenous inhibitor of DNA gyrase (YacG/DUF329 family)
MSDTAAPPVAERNCPICGKPTAGKFSPFCSARCKQIDLNRWLREVYVVPGEEGPANCDEPRQDGENGGE